MTPFRRLLAWLAGRGTRAKGATVRRQAWEQRQLEFTRRVGLEGLDDVPEQAVAYEWSVEVFERRFGGVGLRASHFPEVAVQVRQLEGVGRQTLTFPVSRMTFGTADFGHGRGSLIGDFDSGGNLILVVDTGAKIYPIGEPHWVEDLG